MFVTPADLEPFATIDPATAAAMIADAEAVAVRVAPCLADETVKLTAEQQAYVLAVLRRAILRWDSTGAAGTTVTMSEAAGPLSHSQTVQSKSTRLLWPSEIADLQQLCADIKGETKSSLVHTVVTGRSQWSPHSDICSLRFGAVYCSCGANLTNYAYPLWEGGVLS